MKYLLSAIVFAMTTLVTSAQISIRPQMGFNSSTLTNSLESAVFSDQVGFQFGVDVQMGNKLYLQPGIHWESAKNELKERIDGDVSEISVDRIRIPVMLGYRLLSERGGLLDVRIFTGPNAAFAVSKNVKESPLISEGELKNAVYGWNVGFGADLAIVFIDAGYMFGLSEVFDGMASDVRNNLFYVNAGLRIGF